MHVLRVLRLSRRLDQAMLQMEFRGKDSYDISLVRFMWHVVMNRQYVNYRGGGR